MITRWGRFNIYLLALLTVGLAVTAGCRSAEGKRRKMLSTLRLHAEMRPDTLGRTERIEVFRAQPYWMTIDKQPFLTEANIKEAKVVDAMGGFALQLQFDRQGSWILEQYTAAMRGKHSAVFSQFVSPGEEKINQGRWIAAPLVNNHIADGLLSFTPDASRAEADQIALGLNNVARKLATDK